MQHVDEGTLGDFKADTSTYKYFRKGHRPERASDGLGPYRFTNQQAERVTITQEHIDSLITQFDIDIKEYEKTGSIVLDCFDWWKTMVYNGGKEVIHQTIFDVVLNEYDMYNHHLREINSQPNFGWLRNMFFSLRQ